jgi:hypothetical protein
MPLFYLIPYSFFPKRKKRAVEISWGDILLYGSIAVVATALFFAFLVVPMMMVLNQTPPAP